MRRILKEAFFVRATPIVAKELLGKYLVRRRGRKTRAFLITEVEAYTGRGDMSSHAANGMTKRNRAMFGRPGHWYVYLIYGMYHCLNIVTESHGTPAAVLIRGLAGISGPGKVCRELGITRALYGKPAVPKSGLWIEDRAGRIQNSRLRQGFGGQAGFRIKQTPRINVGGDEKAKNRRWRFLLV